MDKKLLTNKGAIIVLCVICTFLWGSAFPVLKITYSELNIPGDDAISRMILAGIRFFLAGILLFILTKIQFKKVERPSKAVLKQLFILGIFNTTIQYFFFYNGLANTTGIKSAILSSFGTFFVIIAAHFVYHNDKMNLSKVVGLILGFLGIFAVNWKGSTEGLAMDFNFYGEGFLIFSGLTSAFATLYAKKLAKDINPIIMNSWQFLFGSSILLVFGLIAGAGYHLQFTSLAVVLLIYSAFLSATAFTIWFNLLKYNTASSVTIFKFLIPVFGSILSAILIPEEHFTIMIVFGLVCASLGIYMVNRKVVN